MRPHRWRLHIVTPGHWPLLTYVFVCEVCGFHWGADHPVARGGPPPTEPDPERVEGARSWEGCPARGYR